MTQIKSRLSSLINVLFSALLAALGFSSCTDQSEMYGMPVSNFEIKGSVTDEEKQPVDGAEIRVVPAEIQSDHEMARTARTDKDGYYSVSFSRYMPEAKVVCIPKGDQLEADSVIVSLDKPLDTVDFILKPHQDDN